jgi:DNA-binding protein HU-beta
MFYILINFFFLEIEMNRKELIEAILKTKELNHMTKKDADLFVATMLDVVKKTVKKGEDVSLIGFGSFSKVRRAARMGVNPATGEKIKIKAKNLPKFKPGKAWKEMM